MNNELYDFERYERRVKKNIDKFISDLDPKLNLIEKKKYNIYKFYIKNDDNNDIDLVFVYGSFDTYIESDYDFILKNNFIGYDDKPEDYICKTESIECYYELEGLLYVDKIILTKIQYDNCKIFNFYKKDTLSDNINFVTNNLHIETLKNIASKLDEERCIVFDKYEKNIINIGKCGFIIYIESKNKKYIIYNTNKSVTDTIIDLYKSLPLNDLYQNVITSTLNIFDFNNDKIKFLNYFTSAEDIYQKYLLYRHQYK